MKLISADEDFINHSTLRQNIAIASGDWNELIQIVGDVAARMDAHSARQLLQTASLGHQIEAPSHTVRDLLFAATGKSEDDPHILAAAYFLATNTGLEEEPEVSVWLHRAKELSGDDGPLFQASLSELFEKQPEWNRRQEEVRGLLKRGEVPMFLAAKALNSSLIEMMLLPLLFNQQVDDPRRRVAVPAFSGKRPSVGLEALNVIGLDASALLTLGGLGLLGTLGRAVGEIRIPHSTLEWLFTEKRRAAFHQPSRVQRAQEVQNLLADGKLSILAPTSTTDPELRAQVGDELATMIMQAEAENEANEFQHLVVRSAPIQRLGTLLEEEVDIAAHTGVLVSCQNVVEKLAEQGRITSRDAKRHLNFFALNEERWPNEVQIEDNAVLYLDRLSVDYLQSCRLLGELNRAGFTVYISISCAKDNRSLLEYQHVSAQVNKMIEDIRKFLCEGITASKICLGQVGLKDNTVNDGEAQNHPTLGMHLLGSDCDAVIVDDRSLNQHANFPMQDGGSCKVLTSHDLIATLKRKGFLAADESKELMVKLRRGGFLFLGVAANEVYNEIANCSVKDGKLVETAELRAIRKDLLFTRLTSFLHSSDEAEWLHKTILALILALRRIWQNGDSLDMIIARSEWLLPLLDLRGWLHCFPYEQANQILHEGRALYLTALLSAPADISDERREPYLNWIDDRVGKVIQLESPKLFEAIVESHKKFILSYLDSDILDEVAGDD